MNVPLGWNVTPSILYSKAPVPPIPSAVNSPSAKVAQEISTVLIIEQRGALGTSIVPEHALKHMFASLISTIYDPPLSAVNAPEAWKAPPLREYSYGPVPPAPVTVNVPSSTLQSVASVVTTEQVSGIGSSIIIVQLLRHKFSSLTFTI